MYHYHNTGTMYTKTTTIAGKEVTLGYSYATEIGYNSLADESINDFMTESAKSLSENRLPDIKKTIYLILAAVKAYSEWKGEPAAISDRELMYDASPVDVGTAFGTIISLRAEFYHLPASETIEESTDESPTEPKNA